MNHQALIERSHKQARDKGFWNTPLTESMSLALINSEIYEALEAFRKGRVKPDWNDQQAVKDSFEVEIADAAIRIYDWAGGNNLQVAILNSVSFMFGVDEGRNFLMLNKEVNRVSKSKEKDIALSSALTGLYSYAVHHKFDLLSYIEWKLDYNLTRPMMHGNGKLF